MDLGGTGGEQKPSMRPTVRGDSRTRPGPFSQFNWLEWGSLILGGGSGVIIGAIRPADAAPALAEGAAADAPEADAPIPVAASNGLLDAARRKTGKNGINMLKVIFSSLSTRLRSAMVHAVSPTEVHFKKLETKLRTQQGVSEFYIAESSGEGSRI